ncbi:TlpA family protein disulfide reductase [Alteromonas sp. ASW11-130]|uniref:TlpA family protein disulfide reductase n=1 Tax=Alteromonas sp. ASW11-130 TaxID=3015775 RepID=UPI00224202A5|nr:TlpA disulfide reductase family protein [Alteromonas sp. ASW11-130]MCW8092421.1 TlpA family protein disulfide reductase [Alteromonas sp. ASW11-130]
MGHIFSKTFQQKRIFLILAMVIGTVSFVLGIRIANSVSVDFKTVQGAKYRWQQLEGNWVVLNYFAKWCAPCLRELPELNRFAESAGKDVKLFGVNYDLMPHSEIEDMIDEFEIQFEVIPNDANNKLPTQTPSYLPATFIVSPKGKVVATLLGEQTEAGLKQKIKTLKSQTY